MTNCNRCNAENRDDSKFCAICGGRIEPAILPSPPEAVSPAFPSMRGMAPAAAPRPKQNDAAMRGMAVAVAPQPLHAITRVEDLPSGASSGAAAGGPLALGKNPSVAIALSFLFPGGGQFYNGDTKKAVAVFILAILASCLTIYVGIPALGIPLTLTVWVWSFLDAGKVARQQKAIW